MGLSYNGKSDTKEPTRCNWCGKKVTDLVKIRSHEDNKTLRICPCHWNTMAQHAKEWDDWVRRAFPIWGAIVDSDKFGSGNKGALVRKLKKENKKK